MNDSVVGLYYRQMVLITLTDVSYRQLKEKKKRKKNDTFA